MSYNDYRHFLRNSRSFSDLAATYRTGWSRVTSSLNVSGGLELVRMQGAFVTPNLFALFGRSPLLGRTFREEENRRADRVVVISYALRTGRFASSPNALGQDIDIDHGKWRIIGVMPADFAVPFLDTQLWAPLLSHPHKNDADNGENPVDSPRWDVMARLKPAVSVRAAQTEVDSIQNRLKAELPASHTDNVRVVPLSEHFTGNVRKPILLLFAAVAFLLLSACSNVTNLPFARQGRPT